MRENNLLGPGPSDTLLGIVTVFPRQEWWWLLAAGLLLTLMGLAFEWQRRSTLVALAREAPPGSMIVMKRGRGGPAMTVQVGWRPPAESAQQLHRGR